MYAEDGSSILPRSASSRSSDGWRQVLLANPLVLEIGAGCMAGIVEYTSCQPVDMVATRRMLEANTGGARTSLFGDLAALWSEGGVARMYRGLGPQLLAAVPATCGMYVGESYFNRMFSKEDGTTNAARVYAAGFCSGFTETISVCPFEVIKVRLQSKAYVGKYNNTFHCFRTVVAEEGVSRLYSGFSAHAMRNCVFNSLFFSGCYLIREQLMANQTKPSAQYSFAVDLAAGAIMGVVATPFKMPFFVAKSRLQNQSLGEGRYGGTISTMRTIAQEEGITALWKGTVASSVRLSLGGAICLSSFRYFSSLLHDAVAEEE